MSDATFEQKLAAYDDAQHRFEVSLSESKEGDSPIALLKMVSPTNQAVAARHAVLDAYEALKAERDSLKAQVSELHTRIAGIKTVIRNSDSKTGDDIELDCAEAEALAVKNVILENQAVELKALSEQRKQACEAALKELNPQGPWKIYTEDAIVRQLRKAIAGKS